MSEVTVSIKAVQPGDPHAAEQPLPLIYDDLRRLSARRLTKRSYLAAPQARQHVSLSKRNLPSLRRDCSLTRFSLFKGVHQQSVVAVYRKMGDAEAAIDKLHEEKFPIDQVTIIAKNLESVNQVHGYVTACDVSKRAASAGAWVGGLFGILVGAAFLWLPGVGPVIIGGSLASMLLGGAEAALAGAAASGIFGLLAGWGISKQHILKYQKQLQQGDFVVIAHGTAEEVARAVTSPAGSEAQKIWVDAYVYGYPLVTMEMTRRVMTNVAEPTGWHAPMGQFGSLRHYPSADDKDVTARNADTLYSSAWIDLSKEPYVRARSVPGHSRVPWIGRFHSRWALFVDGER
jgi:hypothetical protein